MKNEKQQELEAIADLLHDWAVKWDETYVTVCVLADQDEHRDIAMGNIATDRPDYDATLVLKHYDTPGAATPGASR